MTQENHAVAVGEAVEIVKYAVITYTEGDGKFEKPQVVRFDDLNKYRRTVEEATGGNFDLVVLHTFELKHWMF